MGGGPSIASSSIIPTQTWVKVAATWDGVVRRLYINNTLNSEQASASTPLISANMMKIGRHEHDQGPFFFPGRIDDVRISEVARVFQPDSDGDGIPDAQDLYPGTPPGSIVNSDGGSIDQIIPCAGPAAGGIWKNHGQYVASVAKVAEQFLKAGLITDDQKDAIVSNAAESSCGKKL